MAALAIPSQNGPPQLANLDALFASKAVFTFIAHRPGSGIRSSGSIPALTFVSEPASAGTSLDGTNRRRAGIDHRRIGAASA